MIAENISFGEHSQSEFGLLPYEIEIESPEPKTYLVSIPARNGDLDFTEFLTDGEVTYENREIKISMYCFADDNRYQEMERKCKNALHGRKLKIKFDSDPDYYYLGRIMVEWNSEPNIDVAEITCDCEPFKYKNERTVSEFDVAGTQSIILKNGRLPVCPVVTTDSEITVKFGTETIVFSAGERQSPYLVLGYGDNSLQLSGNGHIKFEYQEGDL